jgi:ATP-dependent DNA ligase
VRLYFRPGDASDRDRFPLIVETLACLHARSFIIDGEAASYGDDGIASFQRMRDGRCMLRRLRQIFSTPPTKRSNFV